MIWESRRSEDEHSKSTDISKGIILLGLSVATSIDSLAVGLSLAFIKIDIIMAGSIVGIASFIITSLGFLLGKKVSGRFGKRAELAGGIILIAIGVRILLTHILAG
jgi:putative Mn2+ efflux pump MntP